MHATIFYALALFAIASAVTYEGYKLYKVGAISEDDNQYLLSLESNSNQFDFWTHINKVGNPVSVMVSPESQADFEKNLNDRNIEFSTEISNVENIIQSERRYHSSRAPLKSGRVTFDQYIRHPEINAYLEQLSVDYSEIVQIETIGQSYEGRDLKLLRISSDFTSNSRPVIFVDAGIHAREWIAPATALYLIQELVENDANRDLIQEVDWIVLPSVNPDGYEYTWTDDRLWRKTVSKGIQCNGCDPNRNWGYHWGETGASAWECSDIYAGAYPFSEIETRLLQEYILATENIAVYLTLHSYGQYLLYPWGYIDELCENWEEHQELGERVNAAIQSVNGTTYDVGGATALLYAAAGASDDWAKGTANIPLVYTIELPDWGQYGFVLPPTRIDGVVKETFEGLKVIGNYVAETNRK